MSQMMSFQQQSPIPNQMGGTLIQSTQSNQTQKVNDNQPSFSINVANAGNSGFSKNVRIHPQSQQQPHMMNMGVRMHGIRQNAQNIGSQGHNQTLQPVLIARKNRNSTNAVQQQQVLNVPKSNLKFRPTFINQRQVGVLLQENFFKHRSWK